MELDNSIKNKLIAYMASQPYNINAENDFLNMGYQSNNFNPDDEFLNNF